MRNAILTGFALAVFFMPIAAHKAAAGEQTLRVEKGDQATYDNNVYLHDRISACTIDEHEVTFVLSLKIPVMMMHHIKDKQLGAIKAAYQDSLQTVFSGPIAGWVAEMTAEEAVRKWEHEADEQFNAIVGEHFAPAIIEFREGIDKNLGSLIIGDPDFENGMEISGAPVPACRQMDL